MFEGPLDDKFKSDFLFKTLAFGHLNLYFSKDVEFISLEELENILGDRKAERWLRKLLRARKQEISLIRLPENMYVDDFHRLFFSESKMFQYYCETQNLPLLNMSDNARIAIVTPLPDKLLELEPNNFWKKWASIRGKYSLTDTE